MFGIGIAFSLLKDLKRKRSFGDFVDHVKEFTNNENCDMIANFFHYGIYVQFMEYYNMPMEKDHAFIEQFFADALCLNSKTGEFVLPKDTEMEYYILGAMLANLSFTGNKVDAFEDVMKSGRVFGIMEPDKKKYVSAILDKLRKKETVTGFYDMLNVVFLCKWNEYTDEMIEILELCAAQFKCEDTVPDEDKMFMFDIVEDLVCAMAKNKKDPKIKNLLDQI